MRTRSPAQRNAGARGTILPGHPVHIGERVSFARVLPADYPPLYRRLISFMRSISQDSRLVAEVITQCALVRWYIRRITEWMRVLRWTFRRPFPRLGLINRSCSRKATRRGEITSQRGCIRDNKYVAAVNCRVYRLDVSSLILFTSSFFFTFAPCDAPLTTIRDSSAGILVNFTKHLF